ncbi:class F sortase [Amycolatopsis sp. NPDC059657]|uniref:class F sortase n=1 Tax=Amycolatopsis sp. NPDC059657 TaxID=3346899 RepID=UPI00367304AC
MSESRRKCGLGSLFATALAVTVALGGVLACIDLVTSPTDSPVASGSGLALAESRPLAIDIPAIGVLNQAVFALRVTPGGKQEVPGTVGSLGWTASSPTPGEPGTAVVTGHSGYGYEVGPFKRLKELKTGDTITVYREDGRRAVFTAYRVTTGPSEPPKETAGPELRLTTSPDDFDLHGDYSPLVVVSAKLTHTS